MNQRHYGLVVLLALAGVLAWVAVFLAPSDDLTFPWVQVAMGTVVILAAAAVAVGRVRLLVAFLATWLPLGLLGAWSVTTSDPLGAVGAVIWLAVSALVAFAALAAVALIKRGTRRVHNAPTSK